MHVCNRAGVQVLDLYGGSMLKKSATEFQHHQVQLSSNVWQKPEYDTVETKKTTQWSTKFKLPHGIKMIQYDAPRVWPHIEFPNMSKDFYFFSGQEPMNDKSTNVRICPPDLYKFDSSAGKWNQVKT